MVNTVKENEKKKIALEANALLIDYLKSALGADKEGRSELLALEKSLANSADLPDDFTWSYLYEIPLNQLIAVMVVVLGMTDLLKAIREGAKNPLELLGVMPSDDVLSSSGWTLFDMLACVMAINRSMDCYIETNHPIDYYVAQARNGDVKALRTAISYDPTVICSPTGVRYLNRVVLAGESGNIKKLGASFRRPRKRFNNYRLRKALHLTHERHQLESLSQIAKEAVFMDKLKVYGNQSSSPKSLNNFIGEWIREQESNLNKQPVVGDPIK